MRFKVSDQTFAKRAPFRRAAYRVDLQLHPFYPQLPPQAARHDQKLDVHVRPGQAEYLGAECMILAVAALLRALVPEQRPAIPQPLRPVVEQVVFQRRAHGRRRAFRAQRQGVTVHRIGERVHFFFDDVGDFAHTAHEQLGALDDRRPDILVAVAPEHFAHGVLEEFPQRGLLRQDIVHPADGLYFIRHRLVCSGCQCALAAVAAEA